MTYGVTVVADDDVAGSTVSLTTGYVGPFAGLDVPMQLLFKDSPYNDIWSITAAEGASTWTIDESNDMQ